jgi:hypothetical protein
MIDPRVLSRITEKASRPLLRWAKSVVSPGTWKSGQGGIMLFSLNKKLIVLVA